MIRVEEAEKIIQSQLRDYGTENIPFEKSLRRVLAEDLFTDRELPPYNRATLDGIALKYTSLQQGIYSFQIKATQAAGDVPVEIERPDECIEIMTGAALPDSTDTVIGYEDIEIKDKIVTINNKFITSRQGVHAKGKDRSKNECVAKKGRIISPALISMAASIGKSTLMVKKLPEIVIISSGDELVAVDAIPTPFQIRRSNNFAITAALEAYSIKADQLHIPDDPEITRQKIKESLGKYNVIILSGGVSMGKYDYIPKALEELSVHKLFHKVKQRPGKPFWFGCHDNGAIVFAFPGNPVSTFMCLYRYCIPWLKASLGLPFTGNNVAALEKDFTFAPALQYFLQVKLTRDKDGRLIATPAEGNGSGDFANLLDADAFMELPMEQNNFTQGEVFPVWTFT